MVKVIVTGGAGFIGSHIVDMLVLEGYEVHIVESMTPHPLSPYLRRGDKRVEKF